MQSLPPLHLLPVPTVPVGIEDARIAEVQDSPSVFADSLVANVSSLSTQLEVFEKAATAAQDTKAECQKRAEDLDTFLQIFQKDLDVLRDQIKTRTDDQAKVIEKKIIELPLKLNLLGKRLNDISVGILHLHLPGMHIDEDPFVPLVSPRSSPRTLPAEQGHAIEKGLQILEDAKFSVQRIRADGNCAPRAIHVEILDDIPFVKSMVARVKADPQLSREIVFQPLETSLTDLETNKLSKDQLLSSPEKSLLWISFLRRSVVNWLKLKKLDQGVFLTSIRHQFSHIKGTDEEVLNTYYDQMSSATREYPLYFGHPEFEALRAIFGCEIFIADTELLGNGQMKVQDIPRQGALLLSRRSEHYDVLVAPK
jgi:hypothetical protein